MGFKDPPGITIADHISLSIIDWNLEFKIEDVWSEVIEEMIVMDRSTNSEYQQAGCERKLHYEI